MQVSKVLVVDGDRAARDALVTCLQFVGFDAHGAENAAAARYWLSRGIADVLVVSDELDDGAHADLITHGADAGGDKASIIVLTRRATAPPPTNYLVDDTLRRPIAVSRVVERIESLIRERTLRRIGALCFRDLSLDVGGNRAARGDLTVDMGHTETRLLAFFIGAPDRVFTRSQLLQRLWPASVRVEERTVDVHIRRLRQALDRLGCATYIQTVRGSGYRFSAFA